MKSLFIAFITINIIFAPINSFADGHRKFFKSVDQNEIKTLVTELSANKYQGRFPGSPGHELAANYLDSLLRSFGFKPKRQSFYDSGINSNLSNILVQIDGKDTNSYIVIGAHYDALGVKNGLIFPGADDNLSGVAAVVTLAKMYLLSGKKPAKTVIFALWDGEEEDFIGSLFFTSNFYNPQRIKLYMNFDMVGRANNGDIYPEISFAWNNNFPNLKKMCESSIQNAFPKKGNGLDITYDMRWGDGKLVFTLILTKQAEQAEQMIADCNS